MQIIEGRMGPYGPHPQPHSDLLRSFGRGESGSRMTSFNPYKIKVFIDTSLKLTRMSPPPHYDLLRSFERGDSLPFSQSWNMRLNSAEKKCLAVLSRYRLGINSKMVGDRAFAAWEVLVNWGVQDYGAVRPAHR